ncbi:MAG: SDR family oxidoreductase [Anaerolineae bacterium]
MDLMLKDRVILVTAASRGLGYATARTLCAEGAHVVLCSRSQQSIEEAAARIREDPDVVQSGAAVVPVAADVTDRADIETLRDTALERFGRIDGLYINAGGPPPGEFLDLTPEDWEAATQLTLQSAVELAYAVVPTMRAGGGGSLLANTSITVRHPLDNLILSNSVRMAVVGLIKSLSIELGPDGIRANAIAPGWTRTERVDQLLRSRADKAGTTPEGEADRIAAEIPLRRMADPTEYARVAAFLLSPAASYITGVTLLVDGGMARAVL